MTSQSKQALEHDDKCLRSEGKFDAECTCKKDPRRLEVSDTSAKKSEVVDRTTSERKYCAIDQFYYSEMFTCPICYGAEQEQDRIIKLLQKVAIDWRKCDLHNQADTFEYAIALIKGEQK